MLKAACILVVAADPEEKTETTEMWSEVFESNPVQIADAPGS